MYQDNQSIRQFERIHARDRLREMAHHVDEDPAEGLVGAHQNADAADRMMMRVIGVAAAALIVAGTFLMLSD